MKTTNSIFILILFLLSIASCEDKIEETRTYKINVAQYMDTNDFRKSAKVTAPRKLENPGKIYFYSHYILINEIDKGIHVYDNSNPASPTLISFIEIIGNRNMSIKNNRLFTDSYIDLIVFDVSDMSNVHQVNRLENIFERNYPQPQNNYTCTFGDNPKPKDKVLVGWEVEEKTESITLKEPPKYFPNWFVTEDELYSEALSKGSIDGGRLEASHSTTGKGGSMTRFHIYKNFLYIAKGWQLKVFDISNLNNPVKGEAINCNLNVETVFIAKDKLFIGATTGMGIYDLKDPSKPEYISVFRHANSCDPVVVDDNYAYVTLRSGNSCQNFNNQLDVINIQDLKNPRLEKTYPMKNPHGLGVDDDLLFICDGNAGLKIYDKSNIYKIDENMIKHYNKINAYDVIPLRGSLMLIGKNGFYQYDYSDIDNIKLISKIEAKK